jgi:hypothetical protein
MVPDPKKVTIPPLSSALAEALLLQSDPDEGVDEVP